MNGEEMCNDMNHQKDFRAIFDKLAEISAKQDAQTDKLNEIKQDTISYEGRLSSLEKQSATQQIYLEQIINDKKVMNGKIWGIISVLIGAIMLSVWDFIKTGGFYGKP